MKSLVLLLFTACVFAAFFSKTLAQTNAPPDAVSNLPGFSGTLPTRNFAGYITVNSTNSARVFYWFTEAENATADTPIIIYTNALGCSSLMNSFLGHGPFWVNKTSSGGYQVVSNQRGWNRVAHMLFVDAPFGSGFSIVNGLNGIEGIPTTDMEAADQYIQFINGFFTLHPELAQLPIYLGAQGLAAKFVTVAAYRALLQKNATSTQTFNAVFSQNYDIRGLVMESDETNPLIGFLTRVDQAFYLGLISHSQWLQLKPLQSQCIRDVQSGNYNFTSTACSLIDMSIKMASGGNSIYDARQFGQFPRLPKDIAWAEWLNIQDVQSALHMDTSVQYIPCNPNVEIAMSEDLLRPVHYLIPRLLAGGMKIFMMHGNFDASGSGSVEFENVLTVLANYSSYPRNLIALGEAIVGYVQEIPQGLTFATIADASYWVTHDHPVTSVTLLEWFLRNQTFAENGTNAIIPRIQLSNGLEIVFQPFGNTSAVNSSDPEYHTMIQPIDSSLINATQPSWLQVPVDISNYMCSILFNNCSGVGQCNNGQCVCQDGHIGPICGYREDNLTTAATLNANQQPSNDWYFLRIPAGNLASNTSRVIISFTQVSQVVMLNNEDPFNTGDVTIHDVGSTIAGGAIPDRLCIYAKLNQAPTFNLFDAVQCYAYEDLSKALVFNIPNLSASANGDWHIGIYNGLRNVALSYGIALSS